MTLVDNAFERIVSELWLWWKDVYEIAWWKVLLNDEWDLAIVLNDWRYPSLQDGYSINTICTEKITVEFGHCIIELEDKLVLLNKWESYAVTPWNKYSISWKSVCRVDISPKRDSSQNSFIK